MDEQEYQSNLALLHSLERNLYDHRQETSKSLLAIEARINDIIRLYITSDRCNLRHEEGANREAVARDGNEAAHQRIIALTSAYVPKAYFALVAAVIALMTGLVAYVLSAGKLFGVG